MLREKAFPRANTFEYCTVLFEHIPETLVSWLVVHTAYENIDASAKRWWFSKANNLKRMQIFQLCLQWRRKIKKLGGIQLHAIC